MEGPVRGRRRVAAEERRDAAIAARHEPLHDGKERPRKIGEAVLQYDERPPRLAARVISKRPGGGNVPSDGCRAGRGSDRRRRGGGFDHAEIFMRSMSPSVTPGASASRSAMVLSTGKGRTP